MISLIKKYNSKNIPEMYIVFTGDGLLNFHPDQFSFWLNLIGEDTIYNITVLDINESGFKIDNTLFKVDKFILNNKGEINLVILDKINPSNSIAFLSKLSIDRSFFDDLTDAITLSANLPYKRPKKMAVFTHVFNEKIMIHFFIKHYSKFVDKKDIYIINHASDPDYIDQYRTLVNVIDIPRGETDHYNLAEFCGHFQRFLLTQYDWVIHIDCDEIFITDQLNNDLLTYVTNFPLGTILKPNYAFELLHDFRVESSIDLEKPVSLQRNTFKQADISFLKPAIASTPTSWTMGFHQCFEVPIVADNLYLIHLRDFDFENSVNRDKKWNQLKRSESDTQLIQDQNRVGPDEFKRQSLAQLNSTSLITMPAWMKGCF